MRAIDSTSTASAASASNGYPFTHPHNWNWVGSGRRLCWVLRIGEACYNLAWILDRIGLVDQLAHTGCGRFFLSFNRDRVIVASGARQNGHQAPNDATGRFRLSRCGMSSEYCSEDGELRYDDCPEIKQGRGSSGSLQSSELWLTEQSSTTEIAWSFYPEVSEPPTVASASSRHPRLRICPDPRRSTA